MKYTGSFPEEFLDVGINEITDSFPPELITPKIVDLGGGNGRVGIAAWRYYLNRNETPNLTIVDNDPAWCNKHVDPDDDTLYNACKDLGLDGIPDSVEYVVRDILEYLDSVEDKFGLALMRSVLQFIREPPERVFDAIQKSLCQEGAFVHACLCFPNEDGRSLYKDMIGKCLELSGEEKFFGWSTLGEIRDLSSKCFRNVEVGEYYALPFDEKYAIKRFEIPTEKIEYLKEHVAKLLSKYPQSEKILHAEIGDSFRIDIPYFVIKCERPK